MNTVLYSEFYFGNTGCSYEAFKNIGRGGSIFSDSRPTNIKLMGTGAGSGFSIFPDFRRYAILFFFKSKGAAESFRRENRQFAWYLKNSKSALTALLIPFKGHGKWGGKEPFDYLNSKVNHKDPIAVITRATINANRLIEFWSNVPKVASFMKSAPAIHQVGIGEYPIFMQATFSIWESLESLHKTAYQNTPHAEVVRKTRARNWYKEELFAEFLIEKPEFSGPDFQHLEPLTRLQAQNPN